MAAAVKTLLGWRYVWQQSREAPTFWEPNLINGEMEPNLINGEMEIKLGTKFN